MEISSPEELLDIINYLTETDRSYFILGNGSNLLVGDKGYEGVILHLGERFNSITVEGNTITAQAGALLSTVAKTAAKNGLSGMEFAAGIPGTIGGAVVMNAGAYEGEMKQIITKVTVMTREGEILELDNETMEFGYRTSIIKNRPFVVLSAVISLEKGDIPVVFCLPRQLHGRLYVSAHSLRALPLILSDIYRNLLAGQRRRSGLFPIVPFPLTSCHKARRKANSQPKSRRSACRQFSQ